MEDLNVLKPHEVTESLNSILEYIIVKAIVIVGTFNKSIDVKIAALYFVLDRAPHGVTQLNCGDRESHTNQSTSFYLMTKLHPDIDKMMQLAFIG